LLAALSGSLEKMMRDEITLAERSVTASVRESAEGLKSELRAQVTAAGLGVRLANTWRSRVYPQGRPSISAAGMVWSNAPTIVRAFDEGPVIRSKDGFWLAIPLPAAGKGRRGKKLTPGEWERLRGQRLRFVYRRGRPSLLVADNQRARGGKYGGKGGGKGGGFTRAGDKAVAAGRVATVAIFLLVPQVHLRKRLNIDPAGKRWIDALPHRVVRLMQAGDAA
jgi:hypothetical protein